MKRRTSLLGFVVVLLAACQSTGGDVSSTTSSVPQSLTTLPPATATTSAVATTSVPPATTSPASTTTVTSTSVAPTTTTTVDDSPPELTVTSPRADEVVTQRSYRFAGTTEPGAVLTAAGRYPVDVASDGSWSIVLQLNPGGNVAVFVAADEAGNEAEVRVPVYFNECAGRASQVIASGATDRSTATGDLDGDGISDTLTVYRDGAAWHLNAQLGYGYAADVALNGPVAVTPDMRVVGLVDVGRRAVLVKVGTAPGGEAFGFIGLQSCALVPYVDQSGQMPVIWKGSLDEPRELFMCEPGLITEVIIAHADPKGSTITLWTERHRIDGLTFLPVKKTVEQVPTTPETADQDFAALVASYPQCGS